MSRRLQNQDGWALVTAVVVMGLILMVGLSILKVVDQQAKEGARERVRESSFNLSEGALYQQSLILSRRWPRNSGLAYPASCDQGSTSSSDTRCPLPSALATAVGTASSIFNSVDFTGAGNVVWTIYVRDNGNAASGAPVTTYSQGVANGAQGTCAAPCTWDANGDKKMWVRAEATVRGKKRMLVALLQLEQIRLPFPGNVVQAGYVHMRNSGNKVIVDTQGTATTGSQILVSCNSSAPPQQGGSSPNPCVGWDAGQVTPSRFCTAGISGCPTTVPPALSPGLLAQLEASADQVFSGGKCPSTRAEWTGIILINATSNSQTCSLDLGLGPINSNSATCDPTDPSTQPGMIIMTQGTLDIPKAGTYCGIIYMPNTGSPPLTGYVVTTGAQADIYGGIVIDNGGGIDIGQAKNNVASIIFDPNAFARVTASGTAGLVQNTWRELAASQ